MELSEITNDFFKGNFDKTTSALSEKEKEVRQIDRLCLQNAIARFLSSGTKDDAFDVYYCFCEIFHVFGNGYCDNTKNLLNILADHEIKAGGFNDKHRDHYSHTVYVFALGISIYQFNRNYRDSFSKHCLCNNMAENEEFLYRWGLCSLFHDVGYPFEIAFNSIKVYTEKVFGKFEPLLTYVKVDEFISFSEEDKKYLSKILGLESKYLENAHTLLAKKISSMFHLDYSFVLLELDTVMEKSVRFIDHAYFSTFTMFKKFLTNKEHNSAADTEIFIDVCINILLHSHFYRNVIGKERKTNIDVEISVNKPLAFLLILCDEVQAFDREGYGKKSKNEPFPQKCYIEQTGNDFNVTFIFGKNAINYEGENFIEKHCRKVENAIQDLLSLDNFGKVRILSEISNNDKPALFHLSASFFQNILCIAMQIHDNYLNSPTFNILEDDWNRLSLELKMSNILQAKSYAEQLYRLGYFYNDRDLMLERVFSLTEEQVDELAEFEHIRWCDEKQQMAWEFAEYDENDEELRKEMRKKRKHNCLVEYETLSLNDKEKDKQPVRNMIPILEMSGFKVYRANKIKCQR